MAVISMNESTGCLCLPETKLFWKISILVLTHTYTPSANKNVRPLIENFSKKHTIWKVKAQNLQYFFISSVRSSSVYHGLLHTQRQPLFQIFQILQIRKGKWKWKDLTCAIFLKSMGFKDIKYDIPVYQM